MMTFKGDNSFHNGLAVFYQRFAAQKKNIVRRLLR
jgi:hypothetical protein